MMDYILIPFLVQIIISIILFFSIGILIVLIRRGIIDGLEFFRGLIIIAIVLLIASFSYLVSLGYIGGVLDFEDNYKTIPKSFEINNITYDTSIRIETLTTTLNGFFVDSYFYIQVTGGYVEFQGDNYLNDEKVELKIYFYHHVVDENGKVTNYSKTIGTKKESKGKYNIIDLYEPMKYKYFKSGKKSFSVALFINGEEVEKNFTLYDYIEVQEAYVKALVNQANTTLALTLWVVLIALLPIIDRFIIWSYNTWRNLRI